MANFCSNYVSIIGGKKKIAILKNVIKDMAQDAGLFETLVGIEPGVNLEEYKKNGWYNSNIKFWGTKWDVSLGNCDIDIESDRITMSFETAWSPPIEFCSELAKKYSVDVEILYDESGSDFCGKATISPDGIVDDESYSYLNGKYVFDKEYFWDEIDNLDLLDDIETNNVDEYVKETYPFLSEEDHKKMLQKIIDNQ